MDMNSILVIVGIVVLLGVAGGCVFGILKVRQLLADMDAKVDPFLDDLKVKTGALKPAAEQLGPLMQQVNVTLDALDMTIVDVDGKLDAAANLTHTISGTMETADNAVSQAKSSVKASVASRLQNLA